MTLLEDPLDQSRYLVHSRIAIADALRSLAHMRASVTAVFDDGHESMPTMVLAVDGDRVLIDCSADPRLNAKLLQARHARFESAPGSVVVRWWTESVEEDEFDAAPALSMALPESLLKLQRRDAYRLALRMTAPVMCAIQAKGIEPVELRAADISIGGIALVDVPQALLRDPDRVLRGCRIDLPQTGEIVVSLHMEHSHRVQWRSGRVSWCAGFRFVDLDPATQKLIQRFIFREDRAQRARATGA